MSDTEVVAAAELRQFVERIERLEEEKKALSEDIREVYAELKGRGYDAKAVRKIVALRKQDASERQEEQAILETYMAALGMLADTPLGEAAIAKATVSVKEKEKPKPKRAKSEDAFKGKVREKLEEAGFVHEGGNTYRAPERV